MIIETLAGLLAVVVIIGRIAESQKERAVSIAMDYISLVLLTAIVVVAILEPYR